MFRSITMTAVAALLAGPAFADGVNYARLSYSYTDLQADNDFFDQEIGLFQGVLEYEVSQFLLSADAVSISNEGTGFSDTDTFYTLSGAYMFTPEALAGLGLIFVDPETGDSTTGFEVFGQYQTAQFGVGLNVRQQDTDEDNITTTVVGEYAVAPGITLGAFVSDESDFDTTVYRGSADYDQGPVTARAFVTGENDVDGGLFGVRGSYEITPQIRASASYQTLFGDDFNEDSVYSIGAGYQIVDGLWFDASYGQIDAEDNAADADRIQAVLSYELGGQTRIDRSFQQAIINDGQAGFGFFSF